MTEKCKRTVEMTKKRVEGMLARVDGQDHINIHVHAVTDLGRFLAPPSNTPFDHPYFGPFNSMEGFWYYIKSAHKDEALRTLWGKDARTLGQQQPEVQVPNFFQIIRAANYYKIEQSHSMQQLLIESTLPFDHYYVDRYSGQVVRPHAAANLVRDFEEIRQLFKSGRRPDEPDYTAIAPRYQP